MPHFLLKIFVSLFFLAFSGFAFGQKDNQRYEVGRRLIAFETEFENVKDLKSIKVVCEKLKPITFYFFSGQLDQCAKTLDLARWICKNQAEPDGKRVFADSLSLTPTRKIIELKDKVIEFEISSVYSVKDKFELSAKLYLNKADGSVARAIVLPQIEKIPQKHQIDIQGVTEGEYQLVMELSAGQMILAQHKVLISLIKDKKILMDLFSDMEPRKDSPFWKASKLYLTTLLSEIMNGKKFEGDIPLKRLTESMGLLKDGVKSVDLKNGGEYMVAFPGRISPLPARLFIPAGAAEKKVPLVVALHGAGATENMFFEAYGAGKARKLCEELGWMLLSPRNGITNENLKMLIDELPVDPEKVVLIGHSMGAGQALNFALNHSKEIAALGLMGGAGALSKNQSLGSMPVYLGVGMEDFARSSVVRFSQEAGKLGKNNILFKEFEGIEHSSICQVCMPEMFEYFSKILKK